MDKKQSKSKNSSTVVDEFGDLDSKLSPFMGDFRRHQELARVIRSLDEGSDPEATQRVAGERYEVILGAREMRTHLASTMEILKALGRSKFLEACSITVKALESACDAATFSRLARKERTGTRPLVVHQVAKAKASSHAG